MEALCIDIIIIMNTNLPTNLRNIDSLASFKPKLKTHLFTKYYKMWLHKHYSACEHSVKWNCRYTNSLLLLLLLH